MLLIIWWWIVLPFIVAFHVGFFANYFRRLSVR